jgi:hypothetical protein
MNQTSLSVDKFISIAQINVRVYGTSYKCIYLLVYLLIYFNLRFLDIRSKSFSTMLREGKKTRKKEEKKTFNFFHTHLPPLKC